MESAVPTEDKCPAHRVSESSVAAATCVIWSGKRIAGSHSSSKRATSSLLLIKRLTPCLLEPWPRETSGCQGESPLNSEPSKALSELKSCRYPTNGMLVHWHRMPPPIALPPLRPQGVTLMTRLSRCWESWRATNSRKTSTSSCSRPQTMYEQSPSANIKAPSLSNL